MSHEFYMRRCFELALKGLGKTSPNPMVGSVIVHENRIIGEGYHEIYGSNHGEISALNSIKEDDLPLLPESTLYVNLEPCCYKGNTPPCADRLIKEKIKKVVVGCLDPNPKIAGKGLAMLEAAGIDVIEKVLEEEAFELNRRFMFHHTVKRPFIILKWAETSDGFIARDDDQQNWISNALSKRISHKWRTEEDAIMVGTNTVLIDNPQLNARMWKGANPLRISIDKELKFGEALHVMQEDSNTIIFTSKDIEHKNYRKISEDEIGLTGILTILWEEKIHSLIVEGGKQLLSSFIEQNLWDEARIFVGDKSFYNGIKAPSLQISPNKESKIGDNILRIYRNL